jgi:hypothetical protein
MKIGNPIKSMYKEYLKFSEYLRNNGQVSYLTVFDTHIRKSIIVSSASYLESQVQIVILEILEHNLANDALKSFVKNKAVERQYHTYFNWKQNSVNKNINQFLGLFGEEFKLNMLKKIKEQGQLQDSINAFIEIGALRNLLVHENFVEFTVEKTPQELYEMFEKAELLIDFLRSGFDKKMSRF